MPWNQVFSGDGRSRTTVSFGKVQLTGTPKIRKRATTRQLITNYIILIICAVFASLAGWIGSNAGTPSSVSPLPLFSVLPEMYLSTYQFAWPVLQSETLGFLLLSAVPFVTYLILNFDLGLSAGSEPVPIRFPILMAIATLASGYWLVSGRMEGIRHQGIDYTNCVTIINILMIIILWTFWCVIRHGATKLTVFLLTALFHGWLFWYAFPWLGQLP